MNMDMYGSTVPADISDVEPAGSALSTDRAEFLSWVKYRAIKEMEFYDDPSGAIASFFSDIQLYSGPTPIYSDIQITMLMSTAMANIDSISNMRYWVDGCN